MKQIALIENGVIINVAAWDGVSPWTPTGYIEVNITNYNPQPGIGWTTSDNINFTNPNEGD
jgi:hypothetical protein